MVHLSKSLMPSQAKNNRVQEELSAIKEPELIVGKETTMFLTTSTMVLIERWSLLEIHTS